MVAEALAGLRAKPNGRYADGTVGGGGHAAAILEATGPNGWLFGCDHDGAAVEAARLRLAAFAGRFVIRRGNYAGLAEMVEPGSFDGVLLDLGVSSPQLDEAGRGFSFQREGPLDMRMDTRQSVTAAELVNELDAVELARIFWELGGEPQSRRLARAIEAERRLAPFETTGQLAAFVERLAPRRGKRTHPATAVFQALRMAVNDELGSLERGLAAAMTVLKSGGRLVVITFHSREDRLVKEFGRARARDYEFDGAVDVPELRRPKAAELRWAQRQAVKPGAAELADNPRSRSAQMRVMEKI
jgi:16S rRNA (cytosine1402-N4)-methyltransferase